MRIRRFRKPAADKQMNALYCHIPLRPYDTAQDVSCPNPQSVPQAIRERNCSLWARILHSLGNGVRKGNWIGFCWRKMTIDIKRVSNH